MMRLLALALAFLLMAIQYPLWLGKGGFFRVWEMEKEISKEKRSNAQLKARNDALDAEVQDLKQGADALEERARSELGLIKQGEVFFQIAPADKAIAKPGGQ
jgi:cell division protein FtsB